MTLYVKPISAFLTRDTEIFSNMDPYVVAIVGPQKQRSKTHNEGGKKPRWNDQLIFRPKASSMLVTVYDEDIVSDDVVGSANVELKKFIDNPVEQEENVTLSYKGKSSGTLKLMIKYTPQQNQLWNQNNQSNPKNIVIPNYGGGNQAYNYPQVPPINNNNNYNNNNYNYNNNNSWQAQPNYNNPTPNPNPNANNYSNNYNNNSWGAQNTNNNNWSNQFNQEAVNLLVVNKLANQQQGQMQQGQGQGQGLNQAGIWGNILNATLQNQQANTSGQNTGWGSQNNGWGSQNNIWPQNNNQPPNNGWGYKY